MKSIFKDKQQAFRCAQQAGIAREIAQMRQNRSYKRSKSEKKPYKPGTLGLSAVSTEIKSKFGIVMPRKHRKDLARWSVFRAHFNGEGPVRVQHIVKPTPARWRKKARAARG